MEVWIPEHSFPSFLYSPTRLGYTFSSTSLKHVKAFLMSKILRGVDKINSEKYAIMSIKSVHINSHKSFPKEMRSGCASIVNKCCKLQVLL